MTRVDPSGADHIALLQAMLGERCAHCACPKIPGWLPFCAQCVNDMPVSARHDIMRIDDVVDGFNRARAWLSKGITTHAPARHSFVALLAGAARAVLHRRIPVHHVVAGRRNERALHVVPDVAGVGEPHAGAAAPVVRA